MAIDDGDGSSPAGADTSGLRFCLLGPLQVLAQGVPVSVGGGRQRTVLAMLLLEAGQVLSTERLIEALWHDDPPATARTQVQICVSRLRARFSELNLPDLIETHESGYVARVPDGSLDLGRFRSLVATGRHAARRGAPAEALSAFRAALELWRGEAVSGVRSRLVMAAALRLNEERLAATEECLANALELGHQHELIGELRELTAAYPLRSKLHAQLMLALYRDGRQAEALEAYRAAKQILIEEHGLDPDEELQTLERAILDNDVSLPVSQEQSTLAPPRQLPAPARGFVGRQGSVDDIRQVLGASGVPVIVSGPPGVGKTSLALHVAHELAVRFTGGQLYAHLRGSDATPVAPEQVLNQFLRALGVTPSMLPSGLEELATLYRSRLAGQPVLVFLDDAAAGWQVAPLLPGTLDSGLVVTSRGLLPGLPDAHRFDLKGFQSDTSLLLLSEVVGVKRVDAEPAEAARLAELCGHLPLALQIAAGKLAMRQHWRIADMAARLADESRRLDELSLDGAGVRATMSVSVETLDSDARRLLLMLSALGTTDFAGWVSAPLLDLTLAAAEDVLEKLVDARLVEVQIGVGPHARYRLHDLVGVFARELLTSEVPEPQRTVAQERMLRCWLFLIRTAHRRVYGGDYTVVHSATELWPLPEELINDLLAEPIAWFEAERTNIVSAVRLASALELPEVCWDLAVTAVTYFEARSRLEDWRETHEVALAAVERAGDRRGEAAVRCSRAGLALVEQLLPAAEADLDVALVLFDQAGDVHGRGLAMRAMASIDRLRGDFPQARQRYERSLTDLCAAGDRIAEAHLLTNLAQVVALADDFDGAEALLTRALTICEEVGGPRVAAQTRYRLGQLFLQRGDLAAAETAFEVVRSTVGLNGDEVGKTYAMLGIGAVRLAAGQLEQAQHALVEAVGQARTIGNRLGEGQAQVKLAELWLRRGRVDAVGECLEHAEKAFMRIGATAWQEKVSEMWVKLQQQRHDMT